jgi:hypothetical protein
MLPLYKLFDRPGVRATYPGIEQDYQRTFQVLRSLPCDVLGWARMFDPLVDKRGVMERKPAQNPFIDPWGYQTYILTAEAAVQKEPAAERDRHPPQRRHRRSKSGASRMGLVNEEARCFVRPAGHKQRTVRRSAARAAGRLWAIA